MTTTLKEAGAGGGAAAEVSIVDGVAAIKATVRDYTSSNPITVELVDTNGDPVSVGGGTQYAEDTVAAAAEILTMAGVVRSDAPATRVNADGDRTELEVDASGRLWVNGSNVTQPVSAASLPLPTGAATSALQTQPGVDIGDVTVNNLAGVAAVNVQDGGNSLTVDGTVSAAQSGTWNITNVSGTVSLPTGASTAANQTSENALLTSIEADLNNGGGIKAIDELLVIDANIAVLTGKDFATQTTLALVRAKTDNLDVALSTRLKPADTLTGVTTVGTITNVVHVDDNSGSLTVDGTVTASGTVATDDPTLTSGATAALSLTTAGRLRIDTEATTRDFDGVAELYVGDRAMRRLAEQAQLDAYLARMQLIVDSEWASSQRMGFEIR